MGSLNQGAIDALKDSLREFGLVDGETIIVVGSPATSPEAVSKTVSNLISQKIDLIFASKSQDEQLRMQQAQSQSSVSPVIWSGRD